MPRIDTEECNHDCSHWDDLYNCCNSEEMCLREAHTLTDYYTEKSND